MEALGVPRDVDESDIDVCICSYLRPQIVETLAAVAGQTGIEPGRIRVVVADNSLSGESRDRVLQSRLQFGLNLLYVHAPANNISLARNACLDAARGRWIAFLDDDELPSANWLAALLEEAERGHWDAVLGPVNAIYPAGSRRWLSHGDFHSARPVWAGDRIETGYTGNVLFERALPLKWGLRFRIQLGKSGGEDEDFFYRFNDVGGRIGFAPEAIVYERVDPNRASLVWLLRRNFRAGQSHGARLRRRNHVFGDSALAGAKAGACLLGAVIHVAAASRRYRYLIRTALHLGVFARLLGFGEIKMY